MRPSAQPADLGRQRQSEQPRAPQGLDGLLREPPPGVDVGSVLLGHGQDGRESVGEIHGIALYWREVVVEDGREAVTAPTRAALRKKAAEVLEPPRRGSEKPSWT